jgi:hypothetical protein
VKRSSASDSGTSTLTDHSSLSPPRPAYLQVRDELLAALRALGEQYEGRHIFAFFRKAI